MKIQILLFAGLTLATVPVCGQSLASRVSRTNDGVVRFSYASRPDVCGNGVNNINMGDNHRITRNSDGDDDSNCPCDYGPVRVTLTMRSGAVTRLRTTVGTRTRTAPADLVDLGTVSTREAAAYLLEVAQKASGNAGGEAIFALTLADSVTPWPDLIRLARNNGVRNDTRKSAVFWLGQAAGDAVTKDLAELAEDEQGDQEVRESAVFALSQLGNDRGVPALIRIAKTNKDPEIRRKALFWLGQSDDPRALDLFEDLLSSN
ncbi:MAG: HEAT repeat domain-containing protein [Gemmatimonadota bacterium]